jgi:DNA repair protein RAD50
MRALAAEEEEKLNGTLNSFVGAVNDLKEVTRQIDEYNDSSNEDDLNQVSRKEEELVEKAKDKQSQIETLQPALDRLAKAVDDQERHKKNLKENIDLILSRQRIDALEIEIEKLDEAASSVEGHDTCYDDLESLTSRKQKTMSSIARLEGRRGEILESIRSLKVMMYFVA